VSERDNGSRELNPGSGGSGGDDQRRVGWRWIVYQRERFPLAGHAPLIAAFSGSAVCLSSMLRGRIAVPPVSSLVVAFVTSLLFFLQLRIADEFKDFEDDSRYRPYRPVPRGLVTLAELRRVGIAAAGVQLAMAVWLEPTLVIMLIATWAYLALMSVEFFVPAWLRARPIAYMLSHMAIMPLIDLYATACDWRVAGVSSPPAGLVWFLIVSFFNGIVVEIGRKIRPLDAEEEGVETYSVLWGRPRAVATWVGAIVATAICAFQVARHIALAAPVGALLALLVLICAGIGAHFLHAPSRRGGKLIELASGIWTLLMYLSLGAVPLAVAVWRA
jgi:4-hydroxybenzoate polyprenyltransferase